MKAGYEILDYARLSDVEGLPNTVFVLNFHNSNVIGLYGYSEQWPTSVADTNENTVAKFTIKPKPCN